MLFLPHRLAIQRVSNSNFSNGGFRHKLVQMVQTMNELFERPYLIVELDPKQSSNFLEMKDHRTKYTDMIMAQISQSPAQVLYSKNQKESAQLIAYLARKEDKKGANLRIVNHISVIRQGIFLFQCFPRKLSKVHRISAKSLFCLENMLWH